MFVIRAIEHDAIEMLLFQLLYKPVESSRVRDIKLGFLAKSSQFSETA